MGGHNLNVRRAWGRLASILARFEFCKPAKRNLPQSGWDTRNIALEQQNQINYKSINCCQKQQLQKEYFIIANHMPKETPHIYSLKIYILKKISEIFKWKY